MTNHEQKFGKHSCKSRKVVCDQLKKKLIFEELLKVCYFHSKTRGVDIFNTVKSAVEEFGGFEKLASVVTDGAKSVTGNKRFCWIFKTELNHCIIHQEALCAKSIKLSTAMPTVTKITNVIRGGNRSLTHRNFMTLFEEMHSAYGDLLLHTEVRWLSRGKCLVRFSELRYDIATFLREEVTNSAELQNDLEDDEFLRNLAFLTDITRHLNVLNLQLQGKKQTICQMVGFVDTFRKKLHLFKSALDKNNLLHFPCCQKRSK
ncbi:hypothetical protein B7P43_G00949 [Cryptotermes secundus]|uniref:General transcription factor II-I repeat domain-containing protein 2A n=1 Tax=Cryptotermes secundus TaxID=105785 RepID=A0A2J7PGB6_9NEOP|nr:hypothetical protein B7P43_G00949 [Cryptotermes secundus]